MTEIQKRFCEEYIKDYNRAEAYLRVRPDVQRNTATCQGYAFLKREDVREYIAQLQAEAVKEYCDANNLMARELLEDITYRDEEGKHSPTWQKSVDLLSKNMGLQKQDISVKQTTITVDIDE